MRLNRTVITTALAALALTGMGLAAAPGASAAPFPTNDESVLCDIVGAPYTTTFDIPLTVGQTHVIAMQAGFAPAPGIGGCDIRVTGGDAGVVQWTSSRTGATVNPAFVPGPTTTLTFTALKGGTATVTVRFSRDGDYGGTYVFTVPQDPTSEAQAAPIVHIQGLPIPASGSCTDVADADYAWGTGLTGGWQRSWEPWAGPNGGLACIRALVNRGTWAIDNSVL